MSKPQEKPTALKRKHPALQNMKSLHFLNFFLSFFALLDPDLQHWNKVYAIEEVNAKRPTLVFVLAPTKPLQSYGYHSTSAIPYCVSKE
jgi:hypothetical protein